MSDSNRLISVLLFCVTALLLTGVLMLNSATVPELVPRRFLAHLIWLSAGVVLCGLIAALIDYRRLQCWGLHWMLLGVALLLLALVLVPQVGVRINGARRWLPFSGQPSELAKVALIVWLAQYGATHQHRMHQRAVGFIYPGLICGLMAGLVFVEPDWGTAAVLATVSMTMLLLAGTRWRYLLALAGTAVPVFILLVRLDPVHFARVLSFLDPEKYQDGIGWQGWHSVLSIGTGGIWGSSCGEGSHKYGFVPEQQTDFIFSLIGEEFGLTGTTAVVLLFSTFIVSGARIVWRIADPFGQLLAGGMTILIGLQALINIGVCSSCLPNKGIPLPFVSYGGSSLVCMLMAVGLLVSIARHAPLAPVYEDSKPPVPQPVSPFAPAADPHVLYATDLVSTLFRRKRNVRWFLFSWVRRWRASRRAPQPLHAYQRLPARHT
jgi:cell division protein FtsW